MTRDDAFDLLFDLASDPGLKISSMSAQIPGPGVIQVFVDTDHGSADLLRRRLQDYVPITWRVDVVPRRVHGPEEQDG